MFSIVILNERSVLTVYEFGSCFRKLTVILVSDFVVVFYFFLFFFGGGGGV